MSRFDLENFVAELDVATQAHLEWTRRVLRCAVLHDSPGDDVLKAESHTLCRFGIWFQRQRTHFEMFDPNRTDSLEVEHQRMHGAIRRICGRIMAGEPGLAGDLDEFEATQRHLVDQLAYFKTLAVSQSSQVDALTGLPLRHRMEQDFDLLTKHLRRRGSAQMVMLSDVDHFKSINDQYGHAGGDAVLQQLAVTLKRVLRADDLVYRYGGEEFLMLMELPVAERAEELAAERVLEAVRAMSVVLPNGQMVNLTVTVGVALAAAEEKLSSVIQRADAAMYRGKSAGRNRYVIAEPLARQP
jgi:diguanylate cyclase (GGDEF)-like protein